MKEGGKIEGKGLKKAGLSGGRRAQWDNTKNREKMRWGGRGEVARRGSEGDSEGEGLKPQGLAPYVPNKQLRTYGKPHTYCKIQIYRRTLMMHCGTV